MLQNDDPQQGTDAIISPQLETEANEPKDATMHDKDAPENDQMQLAAGDVDEKQGEMGYPGTNEFPNANGSSNMMNLNPGFNNGMDYNQMMQMMSGGMGGGMAGFNPMMGKLSVITSYQPLTYTQGCQIWVWGLCQELLEIWEALEWAWPG